MLFSERRPAHQETTEVLNWNYKSILWFMIMCLNQSCTKAPWSAVMSTLEANTVDLGLSVSVFSMLLCAFQGGKIFASFSANYFTKIFSFRCFNSDF